MTEILYNLRGNAKTVRAIRNIVDRETNGRLVEKIATTKRQRVGKIVSEWTRRFVLSSSWERQNETASYWATGNAVTEDGSKYIESPTLRNVKIVYPDVDGSLPGSIEGEQVYATFRNGRWELLELKMEDEPVGPKELFPVCYYQEPQEDGNGGKKKDADGKVIYDRYLLCIGGNTNFGETRRIYSLNLDTRKWSGSQFSSLPFSMSNFDAVIVVNKNGTKELVCGSGYTTQTSKNVIQFYNFDTDTWRDMAYTYNFIGCPLFWRKPKRPPIFTEEYYEKYDGENDTRGEDSSGNRISMTNSDGDEIVVIVGGQGAFYQSDKHQIFSGSGGLTFYGWNITPFWEINVTAGNASPSAPLRPMNYSESEIETEKRFMKTNFKAVYFPVTASDPIRGELRTDFIAFGGTELVSPYNNSVVSYNTNSYVDTVDYTSRASYTKCVDFVNTRKPLGECCVEYVDRVSDSNGGSKAVKRVLCIGGRYKDVITETIIDENGNVTEIIKEGFTLHRRINWMTLDKKTPNGNGEWGEWNDENDKFFKPIPIPRWNAGSILLKDFEREITDKTTGKSVKVKHDLLFLIGGRTNRGLIGDVDVLNLTTNKWELDWPDFNNKVRNSQEVEITWKVLIDNPNELITGTKNEPITANITVTCEAYSPLFTYSEVTAKVSFHYAYFDLLKQDYVDYNFNQDFSAQKIIDNDTVTVSRKIEEYTYNIPAKIYMTLELSSPSLETPFQTQMEMTVSHFFQEYKIIKTVNVPLELFGDLT